LHEHGIDTTHTSLLAALKNSDPMVRWLAASELAEQHDYLDRPAIEDALSTEPDTIARINIAASLVSMDDPVGERYLEALCSDKTQSAETTIRATQTLASSQRARQKPVTIQKCADVVLALFDNPNATSVRDTILLLLPGMYHNASKDKADRMIAIAQSMLADTSTVARMRAGEALAEMGSTVSIGLIHSTMEHESDPNTRRWFQRNLDALQKLQQQPAPAAPANPPH
jgi:HEAT repeat protein